MNHWTLGRGWAATWLLVLLLAACDGGSTPDQTQNTAPEFRAISGGDNNATDPNMGRAETPMPRASTAAYADGVQAPSGSERPNPRMVSNRMSRQTLSRPNARGASDFLWQWGQFLDHDITQAPPQQPSEPMPIAVPPGDPQFDPTSSGAVEIPFVRSHYDPASGIDTPREQIDAITAFIDGSQIYGSDPARARALRRLDGSGKLRTSAGNLLPFNTQGFPNDPTAQNPNLFLSGDVRANEQSGLTTLHTLFMREHNRLADMLAAAYPNLDGDHIYNRARAIVGAELQHITYHEFLPVLLGPDALPAYTGYNPQAQARILNEFGAAAYRLGHSLVSPVLRRLGPDGQVIADGDLPLRDAFFAPRRLIDEGGISPLLRGMAAQTAQELDPMVVNDLRNALFGPPGAGGLDLVALNIQRARDHGLPAYNELRRSLGLVAKTSFAEVSTDPEIQARLAATYANVELIDPWVGCVAEDHLPGTMVGELIFTILTDQFERLRDGDRFWYEYADPAIFTPTGMAEIESTSLAQVIRRNTDIQNEIPDNVFLVAQ